VDLTTLDPVVDQIVGLLQTRAARQGGHRPAQRAGTLSAPQGLRPVAEDQFSAGRCGGGALEAEKHRIVKSQRIIVMQATRNRLFHAAFRRTGRDEGGRYRLSGQGGNPMGDWEVNFQVPTSTDSKKLTGISPGPACGTNLSWSSNRS
jgi:hypothetical protein